MAQYNIGIIGAGASGICAAILLHRKFGGKVSFTIFEKNKDIGGTWLNNVYPGCACDIASHLYSFSFELNPDWSTNFPSQPEILDYLKRLTSKHNIGPHMKFEHEVKRVSWNEELGQWILQYVNLSVPNMEEQTQIFDIIINAPGALRIPLIPDQFEAFKGPTIHTAEWNHEIELKNKKVAVIGSGASAVQVIPSIVDSVETLHCYQRKPPYILPRAQCSFPGSVKFIFRHFPVVMRLFRYIIFTVHELLYSAFRPGSLMYRLISRVSKAYRQNVLKNHKHLWDDLTPKYTIGCKRVILSEQYYPAMARPNVQLHTSPIDNIVDQTIYTKDGSKNEIDVLILATGFRVSDYFGPLEVIGKGGKNILKSWMDDRPRSYYGVSFCDTPNYFYLLGPNTVLGHNSVIFMIECQVNFILNAISEMMKRKAKVLNLKLSAEEEFMNQIDADMKTTVWGKENCGSWYANERGVITILWTDNCTRYWWRTKNIDWSKYEFM